MDSVSLDISLGTVIAASRMLGHKLEDRSAIRRGQDSMLAQAFQKASTMALTNPEQKDLFLIAPFDILVEEHKGENRFHIIETNGTGIGGLTNMPSEVIGTVLESLTEMARALTVDNPLVLVAVSGIESSRNPRHNHLLHEKLLYVEAVKRGLGTQDGEVAVTTMAQVAEDAEALQADRPLIVLGYIKEFLNHLSCTRDGQLTLFGRPVTAGINDRFCLNVVSRFGQLVDLHRFTTINRCFATGADKGLAYELLHEYAQAHPCRAFPNEVRFGRADARAALIRGVVEWLRRGRRAVIKPQGTGLGHGLEFFCDTNEDLDAIIGRIDHSIRVTEHYYGAIGGAFPYTLCEFIDARTITDPGHALAGHKFELRVVVFRDGLTLKAMPSITKICAQGFDAHQATRLSLINNITTSAETTRREGTEFMLPLSNPKTLELLKIKPAQMETVCKYCTGFMRHILDRLQAQPQRFGLKL